MTTREASMRPSEAELVEALKPFADAFETGDPRLITAGAVNDARKIYRTLIAGVHQTPDAKAIAKDRADWLVDAVACATQNRALLRGDAKEDKVLTESLLVCAEKALRVAIERALTRAESGKTTEPSAAQVVSAAGEVNLRSLVLDMGRVIRALDEGNEHSEFWTQDGDYVIDGRFPR